MFGRMRLAAPLSGSKAILVSSLLCLWLACQPAADPPSEYVFEGPTMGTTFRVKVVSRELTVDQQEQIRDLIRSELEDVNATMSTYRESSELSRFNQSKQSGPFSFSEAAFQVFLEAQRIGAATNGAFDITVGPLVNAWGFGPDKVEPEDLGPKEVNELRSYVGWDKIVIDEAAATVHKMEPGVYCDLSGIAKGFAVDEISQTLTRKGYGRHMVEVGGEIRTRGRNLRGTAWRIAIERPLSTGRQVQRIVPLSNQAMATSGDYRNFYEEDGVRFSHTIDPRSGRPVQHRLASVSVIDPSCMRADGYATAFMVMGEEEGYRFAEENDIAALFLVRRGPEFEEKPTAAFDELLENAEPDPQGQTVRQAAR